MPAEAAHGGHDEGGELLVQPLPPQPEARRDTGRGCLCTDACAAGPKGGVPPAAVTAPDAWQALSNQGSRGRLQTRHIPAARGYAWHRSVICALTFCRDAFKKHKECQGLHHNPLRNMRDIIVFATVRTYAKHHLERNFLRIANLFKKFLKLPGNVLEGIPSKKNPSSTGQDVAGKSLISTGNHAEERFCLSYSAGPGTWCHSGAGSGTRAWAVTALWRRCDATRCGGGAVCVDERAVLHNMIPDKPRGSAQALRRSERLATPLVGDGRAVAQARVGAGRWLDLIHREEHRAEGRRNTNTWHTRARRQTARRAEKFHPARFVRPTRPRDTDTYRRMDY
eukprot:gene16980-biopygen11501